jgi:hypothetical protein
MLKCYGTGFGPPLSVKRRRMEDEVSHGFNCCINYSFITLFFALSIPVTARSKAWVGGLSLAGISGSNPAGVMDLSLSLASVVCCQVEVYED